MWVTVGQSQALALWGACSLPSLLGGPVIATRPLCPRGRRAGMEGEGRPEPWQACWGKVGVMGERVAGRGWEETQLQRRLGARRE